ncbi:hypothetical protein B0T49_21790 [Chromobacterium violaceum]|uniref:hypothetical protein n=1 Tax=Chromobacterium violaceum TaxID=536 RepID=UPI0009DA8633|nr:hypothetical protein [Chromobacterium violaceum]OQS45190.1 hypothetical protein B0T49_21790 [Chromobacterium violaceum]OQS45780.1 hypothetical protein B0T48_17990 [Chromobacterium violaceum]
MGRYIVVYTCNSGHEQLIEVEGFGEDDAIQEAFLCIFEDEMDSDENWYEIENVWNVDGENSSYRLRYDLDFFKWNICFLSGWSGM